MHRSKRFLLTILVVGVVLTMVFSISAFAQDKYPTKPITYLVPFNPGGLSDLEARRQQPLLTKLLGQKIIVDYKVGGGGALGWSELVRAKPDGYLICGINIPHIILQPLQQETGFKTEDILPLFLFQRSPMVLAVLKDSPYKDLKGFLEAAKAKPGEISIGGSGTFSGNHIATLRLAKMTGTKFNYVPFTGSAPVMTAFIGGHVNAVVASTEDILRYADSIRGLGTMDEQRFPGYRDSPTFKELGLDLVESIDRGVGLPPNTPEPIIKKLESAFHKISQDPDIREQMEKAGSVLISMGHAESMAHIAKMKIIYKDIIKDIRK